MHDIDTTGSPCVPHLQQAVVAASVYAMLQAIAGAAQCYTVVGDERAAWQERRIPLLLLLSDKYQSEDRVVLTCRPPPDVTAIQASLLMQRSITSLAQAMPSLRMTVDVSKSTMRTTPP